MNKKWVARSILASVVLLFVIFTSSLGSIAQESPFHWEYINVNMDVEKNGDILVTETQKYIFDRNHTNRRYRYIPLDKVAEIKDISITENNRLIPTTHKIADNKLSIEWQHQLKAPSAHTFVLKYRIIGGLQVEGESTLVYWKAIFANRTAPVDRANVRVQLPPELAGQVSSFTSYGASSIDREVNPRTFEFVASELIQPGQELEIKVAFPNGIITHSAFRKGKHEISMRIILENIGFLLVGFSYSMIVGIPWVIIVMLRRLCPKCKAWKLERKVEVLVSATRETSGMQQVTHHCSSCSYHRQYNEATYMNDR